MLEKIKNEKAQSLVEMAFLMPILVLIIAGLLDLGRAYYTYIALSDAAAEGATYASIHPQQTDQIIERAADSTSGNLVVLDPEMIHVIQPDPLEAGHPITVTVEYDFVLLLPLTRIFVPEGVIHFKAESAHPILGDDF